ncbi:MAG TPA: class I SAM-dependent methyltransferase [Bacillota bacterium]|nr:class I SAM-dependent methyltransferase [Bacillota bacterium]
MGHKTYYWCPACDYIFLDPKQRLSPEEERARYEEHSNSIEEPGYVKFLKGFLDEAVKHYLRRGMRVLDYGCGPGPVLYELLRRDGYQVDTYDPFFSPAPPEGTYDLITCTEVVEHVHEPVAIWSSLVDRIAPGGMLCLMTRLHPGIGHFSTWWYHRDPTHVGFYNHRTLNSVTHLHPLRLVQTNNYDKAVFRRL